MNTRLLIGVGIGTLLVIMGAVLLVQQEQTPTPTPPSSYSLDRCETYACIANVVQQCERGRVVQYTPARPDAIEQFGTSGWQQGTCTVTQERRTQQGTRRGTCTFTNAQITDTQSVIAQLQEGCL